MSGTVYASGVFARNIAFEPCRAGKLTCRKDIETVDVAESAVRGFLTEGGVFVGLCLGVSVRKREIFTFLEGLGNLKVVEEEESVVVVKRYVEDAERRSGLQPHGVPDEILRYV